MSRTIRALACVLGLTTAGLAAADSILDFDVWMQKIDHHSQAVLLRLKQGRGDAAVAEARALEDLYLRMERFYEARGEHDDPLLLSYDGRQRAAAAARLTGLGDLDGAFAEAAQIARDCRACHDRFKPLRNPG